MDCIVYYNIYIYIAYWLAGIQRQTILWNILRTEYDEIYSQGRPLVDSLEFLKRCHPLTYTMVSYHMKPLYTERDKAHV